MKNREVKITGSEHGKIRGVFTIEARNSKTGELVGRIVSPNTVMVGDYTGLDQFVKRLTGDVTYSGTINYVIMGTNPAVISVLDTSSLTGESARAVVSTAQDLTYNQARIKAFFTDSALHNGTYYEIRSVVDGSATRNSGQLFNRALFSTPYAKVSGVDTTVQVDIYFT